MSKYKLVNGFIPFSFVNLLFSKKISIVYKQQTGSLNKYIYQELLIQYGADFKTADHYGLTPLYLAKSKGFEGEAVFKYLLSEGAPYNEIKSVDVSKVEKEIAQKMAQIDDDQRGHKEDEPQ